MNKMFSLLLAAQYIGCTVFAQNVAINNNGTPPHASAMIDIQSNSKGMLIPRMTTGEKTAIANPANGLTIYNISTKRFEVYNNGWGALQPELPPGTSVISDSITNAPLAALGFKYAGYFEQMVAMPPQPVAIGGNGWFKINQTLDDNAGAPGTPFTAEGNEPDMTNDLVVNTNDEFVYFNQDSIFQYNPTTNLWSSYWVGFNQCRYGVWTGTEVLGWNGFDTIYKYNPASHVFTKLRHFPLLNSRTGFSIVWTGTEMIVWGGKSPVTEEYYSNGTIFNPASNTWATLPVTSFPARAYHTAVWTGTQMIIHGGETSVPKNEDIYNEYDPYNAGYNLPYDSFYVFRTNIRYTRSTNSWGAPVNLFTGRSHHSAIWTGTEMVVFGGMSYKYVFEQGYLSDFILYEPIVFNSGFRQNPSTGISVGFTAPWGRYQHTAVWDGVDMRLIGGYTGKMVDIGPPSEFPPYQSPEGKEVCAWVDAYRPNPGIWGVSAKIPGGVVKNFTPYAFVQNDKIFAFGQTVGGKEQGYVRSFTTSTILQAVPPVGKRIFLFKRD